MYIKLTGLLCALFRNLYFIKMSNVYVFVRVCIIVWQQMQTWKAWRFGT